jgi:hypothetical protein
MYSTWVHYASADGDTKWEKIFKTGDSFAIWSQPGGIINGWCRCVGRNSSGRATTQPKLVNINPEEDRNIPVGASNSQTGLILGIAMKETNNFTRSIWNAISKHMAKNLHNASGFLFINTNIVNRLCANRSIVPWYCKTELDTMSDSRLCLVLKLYCNSSFLTDVCKRTKDLHKYVQQWCQEFHKKCPSGAH